MQDQDTNNEFESHWTRSCQGETKYKEIKLTMQNFINRLVCACRWRISRKRILVLSTCRSSAVSAEQG